MTRQKRQHGFTLVELATTIVIIAILASITIIAYGNVQRQARDEKREVDILSLASALDKYYNENGNYPLACEAQSTNTCAVVTGYYNTDYPGVTVPPLIGRNSTLTNIRAILPGIGDNFGDPSLPGNPINQSASLTGGSSSVISKSTYLFSSRDMLNRSSSSSLQMPTSFITCWSNDYQYDYQGIYTGNRPHDYILGYYSETESKWKFYRGPRLDTLNDSRWSGPTPALCVPTIGS